MSSLHVLLRSCTECGCDSSYEMTDQKGAFVEFTVWCMGFGAIRTWSTTPKINKTSAINVLLSGSVLFPGSSPTNTLRFLNTADIAAPAYSRYLSCSSKGLLTWCKSAHNSVRGTCALQGKKINLTSSTHNCNYNDWQH